jgi:uncharacterized membrane protein
MKLHALVFTTIAFVVVSAVVGAVLYDRLPDRLPTHFDVHGQPNGFTAKPFAVVITPAAVALTGLVFFVLPWISPKGYRIEPFLRTYEIIAIAVLAMELTDGMLSLSFALGHPFDTSRGASIGLGLLLLVIGNFLGKMTRNFFVGIRTPWTLASPEVWLRTHRVGGPLFVIAGAIILIVAFAGTSETTLFVTVSLIVAVALFLTVYSYVLYRQIENGSSAEEEP